MVEKAKILLMTLLLTIGIQGCTITAPHIPGVIHVPEDYPTIQEALDDASTGDTVLVAPGIYYENTIWPNTDGIVLLSEHGPDSTIIDGGGGGDVIRITTGVSSATVIQGFTIKNGSNGIYCRNSSPTIIGNTITGNSVVDEGGGIYCKGNAVIMNNTIANNNAWQGSGGGIFCSDGAPTIIGNKIIDNYTSGVCCGPKFWEGRSLPIIYGNTISNNLGQGIWAKSYSEPEISNNTISDNIGYGIKSGCTMRFNVNHNNITDNTYYGIYQGYCEEVPSAQEILNAESNWWGSESGPSGVGPGTGDKVNEYVDYTPWLTEPVGIGQQTKHCTTNVKRRPIFRTSMVK